VNGSVTAGADFVAGFMYGMTGDNHLTEIEACYQGGQLMTQEVEAGIADIKKGGWDNDTQAALQFGLAVLQIPQALNTCKGMDDDIAAIEAWAQIFTDPTKLAATVSKHYLLHKKQIQTDITTLETDWDAHLYFQAGEDLAALMTLAVGPITPTPAELNMTAMAVPDFIAGFIYGMTGDNDLTEIEACYQGGDLMVKEVEAGIAAIKKGGWDNYTQAALYFSLAALQIPQALSTCEGMDDDIAAIEAWGQIFEDPTKLAATVSKNYLLHKKKIEGDITQMETDWDSQLYFNSGEDFAALCTVAIGPITPTEITLPPINMVPDFVAGLIYGFTGDNHLDEMQTCMKDGDALVKDAEKVLADIKGFHVVQAVEDFGTIIWALPDAVAGCEGMDDDIAAIEQWATIFKQPTKLAKIVSKNWLFHGPEVKKDLAAQKTAWAAQNYFEAGQDAAKVIVDLVGPVNPTELIPLF